MKKTVFHIGLIACIIYFLAVGLFLMTKTEFALTLWEMFTIIGAFVILFILIALADDMHISSNRKLIMTAFMGCTCALTTANHIVNMSVTRRLIAQGVQVPNYFKIGYWPSVEMAIDYVAWGLFVGLAFFTIGFAIEKNSQFKKTMMQWIIGCAILCFLGFFGTFFVNENLWYFAPVGYGAGTILICMKMIKKLST